MYWLLLLVAAIVLLPMAALAVLSLTATRPSNLGVRGGRLAACPASPNCVSTQADDAGHRMEPIPFQGPPVETMARIASIVSAMPGMRVVTQQDNYLHAEATSRLFRFVDDVEFYLDVDSRLIHFRSASRVGRSDFGVNRARMQQIQAALRAH